MSMTFPFAVIDFEASSLSDERSYPIEIGVAIAVAPAADRPIRMWSSLIRPAAEWIASGQWSARSAAVHRIALHDLADGASPNDVARALNRIAGSISCWYCDGGEYDAHWLRRLYAAARVEPAFHLVDVRELFGQNRGVKRLFDDALARTEAPHRAGADAARLCAAILAAHDVCVDEPPSHAASPEELCPSPNPERSRP